MRVAPAVQLSPEERAALTRRTRLRGHQALRARIVLRAADGAGDQAIAHELGISRAMASRWRRRFLTARLQGMERAPRTMSRDQEYPHPRRQILRLTIASDRPGGGRWSTRSLATRFGVSHMTIQRIRENYRLTPRGRGAREGAPTSTFVPDIAGVHLGPGSRCLLLATPAGTRPPRPAPLPSTWDPSLLGWGPRTQPLTGESAVGTNHRYRLQFLERVLQHEGEPHELWVISEGDDWDSESFSPAWKLRHPRVHLPHERFIEPWLARVAQALGSDAFPGGAKSGRGYDPEVNPVLLRYLASYREGSPPYTWAAEPRDLAEGNGRTRLRYALAVTAHPGFIAPGGVLASMTAHEALDSRSRAMATTVLTKSLRIRRGENVTIDTWSGTLPYARAFVLEARRLGATPFLIVRDEPAFWAAVDEVNPRELAGLSRPETAALRETDCMVSFFGPSDRARWHALPHRTMMQLCKYEDSWYGAVEKARVRAIQLALGRASESSAKMYGVELARWQDELVEGSMVDPLALRRSGRRIAAILAHGRELRIRHENGTDLTVRLQGKEPQVEDGVAEPLDGKSWGFPSLPSGVVRAPLDEHVADGVFRSNVPSSVGISDGVGEFAGGRWTFAGGKLSRYTFEKGQRVFGARYAAARKGKERPGSVSIGLNPAVSMIPLLEDQGLGTVTLLIGQNDSFGGSNHFGWWAWLYLRGADLDVDGRRLIHAGKLKG